ncbi:hypothetical protein C8R42DRAFT_687755 [Lentinula raphanica]|nr:hypothetical protein C8R42DRAFT_687755 [Lentinula raphanica]
MGNGETRNAMHHGNEECSMPRPTGNKEYHGQQESEEYNGNEGTRSNTVNGQGGYQEHNGNERTRK